MDFLVKITDISFKICCLRRPKYRNFYLSTVKGCIFSEYMYFFHAECKVIARSVNILALYL